MRLSYLAYAIGIIMIYIGIVILAPAAVAIYYHEYSSVIPFVTASLISMLIGLSLRTFVQGASAIENLNDIKKAEALFIVAVSWMVFGIISAIPYLFYGITPLDALFESVSGITTTGATILTNFNYAHAFFFWRSLTQWLGGLGIIVLFIATFLNLPLRGVKCFLLKLQDQQKINLHRG